MIGWILQALRAFFTADFRRSDVIDDRQNQFVRERLPALAFSTPREYQAAGAQHLCPTSDRLGPPDRQPSMANLRHGPLPRQNLEVESGPQIIVAHQRLLAFPLPITDLHPPLTATANFPIITTFPATRKTILHNGRERMLAREYAMTTFPLEPAGRDDVPA